MKEVATLYPGSENALYIITDMVAHICTTNMGALASYKKKYTPAFIQALQESAERVKNMPNYSARQGTSLSLRRELVEASSRFCSVFAGLMGYINDSFPLALVGAMKKIAGADFYLDALRKDWSAAYTLAGTGAAFLESHSEALLVGGMAEDFPALFISAAEAFESALSAFSVYKNAAQRGTNAKVSANNDLYNSLLAILKDARYVLSKTEGMKQQLYYYALRKKVKGPGKTGFRITLKLKEILTPVSTASIMCMPTGKSFAANAEGIIEDRLPGGEYNYTLTAPGFATIHGELTITAGKMRRVNIKMTTAAALEATA